MVSGASSGIGKEFAEKLRACKYNIAGVGRTVLDKVDAFLPLDFESPDIADLESINKFLKENNVTLLINAAGVSHDYPEPFKEMKLSSAVAISRCNINSVLYLTKLVLEHNVNARIVNISSAFAYVPSPLLSVYGASKAFVSKFTDSLSREGTDVVLLEPFLVATKMSKVRSSLLAPSASTYVDWLLKWGSYPPHQILAFLIKHVPIVRSLIKRYIVYKLTVTKNVAESKRSKRIVS